MFFYTLGDEGNPSDDTSETLARKVRFWRRRKCPFGLAMPAPTNHWLWSNKPSIYPDLQIGDSLDNLQYSKKSFDK